MNKTSSGIAAFANRGSARTCPSLTEDGSINSAIVLRIKALYASKTVQVLAAWLGVSERTAKHRLSNSREFTVDEVAKLLHSEHGFEIIAAIMSRAVKPPAWWKICAPVMEAADIRKMQLLAQRRIAKALEGAIDADRNLSAAIARADALAIQDEDFARPHIDALRSMSRVSDRSLAKGRVK